jgi:hypothetical protein
MVRLMAPVKEVETGTVGLAGVLVVLGGGPGGAAGLGAEAMLT